MFRFISSYPVVITVFAPRVAVRSSKAMAGGCGGRVFVLSGAQTWEISHGQGKRFRAKTPGSRRVCVAYRILLLSTTTAAAKRMFQLIIQYCSARRFTRTVRNTTMPRVAKENATCVRRRVEKHIEKRFYYY